jgi:monoterpene epsilon-lactone hydrolase
MSEREAGTGRRSSRRDLLKMTVTATGLAAAGAGLARPLGAEERASPPPYAPPTVSPEAQQVLKNWSFEVKDGPALPDPGDLDAWKRIWEENEAANKKENEAIVAKFGATVERLTLGGVPVLDVKPRGWTKTKSVLVYVHGGAYTLFSAASTLTNAVPHAHDTGHRIISIDYTCAPFARFQAMSDQVVAVMKALVQDGRSLEHIAIFGDSAGGGLAAASVLKMRDQKAGMPAAVVLQSPWGDLDDGGDTYHTLKDADLLLDYKKSLAPSALAYADEKDHRHPYASPVHGDYSKGYPPTLIQGGTKEIFLSNFVRLYQAMDQGGVDATLDIYEGMWHVFQAFNYALPESVLARKRVKRFLKEHLA